MLKHFLRDLEHVVKGGLCFIKLSLVRVFTAKLPGDVDGARKSTLVVSYDGVLDFKPEV